MASDAIKLEREKRKTARQEAIFKLLERPEVIAPLMGLGTFALCLGLGKSRMINRDAAGFMAGIGPVLAAGSVGINDKYALLGIYGAAATAYALAVPAREDEAIVSIDLGKLYGGDGKLFGLTMPSWLGGGEVT
jgi:hypothetical protein